VRVDCCPTDGVEGLFEVFLWTGNRVTELGDRRIERELGVLTRYRGWGRTERLGVEGRRIPLDPEERLRLEGGLTRTVGRELL
jgi:hypothetical protein